MKTLSNADYVNLKKLLRQFTKGPLRCPFNSLEGAVMRDCKKLL